MPRLRTIPGPSHLSRILAHLTKQPRLELNSELKKLRLSYKFKNGDFGARSCLSTFHRISKLNANDRYFAKEELPRIRYANPTLPIEVDKLNPSCPKNKSKEPSLILEFGEHPSLPIPCVLLALANHNHNHNHPANAPRKTLPLASKWSTEILMDLMFVAGSARIWPQWVEERKSRGESIYMDKYGNGKGKEGYIERERVRKIARRPKRSWGVKRKAETESMGEMGSEVKGAGKEKVEERDEVKELLGLDTMETEPPTTGVAAALP
jgi:small subunit ribosomal protein S25